MMRKGMMKKFWIILVLIMLSVFSFAACGDSGNTDGNTNEPQEKIEQETTDTPTPQEIYYTVSFDTGGVIEIENQTVKQGEKATRPQDPEDVMKGDTSYRFIGWYIGEEEYDFNQAVNGNITIKVKWETEQYSTDIPIKK